MYLMQLIQARNIEHTKLRYKVSRRYKKGRLHFCTQACSSVRIFVNVTQPDDHSNKTTAYQIRNKASFCFVWKPQQYSCYILFILSPFGIPLSSNTLFGTEKIYKIVVTFGPFSFAPFNPYTLSLCTLYIYFIHTRRSTPTLDPHSNSRTAYYSPCVINKVSQTIPPHTTVTLLATFHALNSL